MKAGLGSRVMAKRSVRDIVLLIAVTGGMLAGCATERIAWDKQGVTQTERERDENACLRTAIGTDGKREMLAPYCIDRDTYTRCMESRGYTVRSR